MINAYFSHSLVRKLKRVTNEIRYRKLIQKNRGKRILVILHLFYENSWKEIREYLLNLQCFDWSLYVTAPQFMKEKIEKTDVSSITKNVKVFYYENIGYDIGPFFDLVKNTDISEYDAVIKLQSKGVHRKYIFIHDQLFLGRTGF